MIVKKLELKNFRNYSHQEFDFNNKFNFIYGENGQGKTNILEGISYTAFSKSFLGASEQDCVSFGKNEFIISTEYLNALDNTDKIAVNYNADLKSKTVLLNKEKVTRYSSEIFGRYPVVYLTPRSLNITYGNPSERRKFFDILISQSSRLYLDYLKDLAKILKQKNILLREFSQNKKYSVREVTDLISAFNENLIEVSAHIVFKRLNFLSEYKPVFMKNFSSLIDGVQKPGIEYNSDAFGSAGYDAAENSDYDTIHEILKSHIQSKFDEEMKRGISAAGPQRDDYLFKMSKDSAGENFFELKNFASQGEHKTFLTALKLAEFDYLKEKRATTPILMLDDVLSELDESRVSKIISHLNEFGQIFLTTTDKSYLENLYEYYDESEVSIFEIKNGRVV